MYHSTVLSCGKSKDQYFMLLNDDTVMLKKNN